MRAPTAATIPLDACESIVQNAQEAQGLFTAAQSIPGWEDVPTVPRPPRTTVTTTVTTQSGLLTRAICLTSLARQNLAYFDRHSLCGKDEREKARQSLAELTRFIEKNKDVFRDIIKRDEASIKQEVAATQQEIAVLRREMDDTQEPEERALIQGQVNVSNLRLVRLGELGAQIADTWRFFQSL